MHNAFLISIFDENEDQSVRLTLNSFNFNKFTFLISKRKLFDFKYSFKISNTLNNFFNVTGIIKENFFFIIALKNNKNFIKFSKLYFYLKKIQKNERTILNNKNVFSKNNTIFN